MNLRKPAILVLACILSASVSAQDLTQIADNTIGYLKAGTFGKPDVAKKTSKLALAQVRVHYKIASTSAASTRDNGARVTVYLDGDMTNDDLQKLTNEFYSILQRKLSTMGIGFADWQAISATEYFSDRELATAERSNVYSDGSNGQAWVSFTANHGPLIYRYSVDQTKSFGNELLAFGKLKKVARMSESLEAEIATVDVVLDFTSIVLATEKGTVWQDGGKYVRYGANMDVAAIMNVPQSYILMVDRKLKFDQYASKLPVAERGSFSEKPYSDPGKAALKTKALFGEPKFTFTPVVISAKRELFLLAARRTLELYADILAEKMRSIRGVAGNKVASQPVDNTTREQVVQKARAENDTTPVTTNEITAAAKQAEKERKFQLAIDYYGELIKLNPDDSTYYLSRGALYLNELKDQKSAIKDFEKGIALNPNEPAFFYNRGSAYLHTGDFKKAKKDLDSVIALRPTFVAAYLNRGIAHLNLKDYEAALADFEKGISLDPRMPNLYRARAIYYKVKGNAALAQADELRAAQLER